MVLNHEESPVQAVRRFNRFYTKQIGLLGEGLLRSWFSLTEVRVMYELAHRDGWTASELSKELGLDPGYLSRILRKFQDRGLIERAPSEADGRQNTVKLTDRGLDEFEPLNAASNNEVAKMLDRLTTPEQIQLVRAMKTIGNLLVPEDSREPYLLRSHQPGDMGWVVHRHGTLYAQEHGYNEEFEALVAEIVAEFIRNFDSKRERCWIAERNGEIVGSIFLVKKDDETGKLRLFYVEPSARGMGIGKRLVEECLRFAKQAGYKKIVLWTQSHLDAARHIYEKAGFERTSQQKHKSFGKELEAEVWEKALLRP